jgi:hypothetical protein
MAPESHGGRIMYRKQRVLYTLALAAGLLIRRRFLPILI